METKIFNNRKVINLLMKVDTTTQKCQKVKWRIKTYNRNGKIQNANHFSLLYGKRIINNLERKLKN